MVRDNKLYLGAGAGNFDFSSRRITQIEVAAADRTKYVFALEMEQAYFPFSNQFIKIKILDGTDRYINVNSIVSMTDVCLTHVRGVDSRGEWERYYVSMDKLECVAEEYPDKNSYPEHYVRVHEHNLYHYQLHAFL